MIQDSEKGEAIMPLLFEQMIHLKEKTYIVTGLAELHLFGFILVNGLHHMLQGHLVSFQPLKPTTSPTKPRTDLSFPPLKSNQPCLLLISPPRVLYRGPSPFG